MTEKNETILIKYNQIGSEMTDSNFEEINFGNIDETKMFKDNKQKR